MRFHVMYYTSDGGAPKGRDSFHGVKTRNSFIFYIKNYISSKILITINIVYIKPYKVRIYNFWQSMVLLLGASCGSWWL